MPFENGNSAMSRRDRETDASPPFDPVQANAEHDAARKSVREMGRAARNRR
jgi:hypothetical protein